MILVSAIARIHFNSKNDSLALDSINLARKLEPNSPQTIFLDVLINIQANNVPSGSHHF